MLERYKTWARGPMGLIFGVVGLTTSAMLTWKYGISPMLKKRRQKTNEEFANFVWQERQKKAAGMLENSQQ